MNEPGARDAPERHIPKTMSNRFLSYFIAERLLEAAENLARALASCQAFLTRRRDERAVRKYDGSEGSPLRDITKC